MRIVALALAFLICSLAKAEEAIMPLDSIRFPQLQFREATVMDILTLVRWKVLRDSRPDWYKGAFSMEIRFTAAKMNRALTFKLENVSLRETLDAICKEADIVYRIVDDRIVFDDP